jgi:putative FmdB family regulatory protein
MPTYQYACTTADCGNEFDLVQSFTDPSASQCPRCGGPVRKVFSAVGVVFKGPGFYRTDSRAAELSSASSSSHHHKSGSPASGETPASAPSTNNAGSGESSSSGSASSGGSSEHAKPSSTSASKTKAAASA